MNKEPAECSVLPLVLENVPQWHRQRAMSTCRQQKNIQDAIIILIYQAGTVI